MPRVQWPRRRDGSGNRPKHALSGRSHQIRSQAAGPDAALYEQIDLGQGSGGHRGVLEIGAEGPGPENDSLIESTIKNILKLDESCTSNPKLEIANWTLMGAAVQSEISKFRIRDAGFVQFLNFSKEVTMSLRSVFSIVVVVAVM